MKKQKINGPQFPENLEIWQGLNNGEVAIEHPSRAIVNGYLLRNSIPGKPVAKIVKFDSVYAPGSEPGDLKLIGKFATN